VEELQELAAKNVLMAGPTALCSGIGPPHIMANRRLLETAAQAAGARRRRAIVKRRMPGPTAMQSAIGGVKPVDNVPELSARLGPLLMLSSAG
jgi:hypothetical protein